MKVSTECYKCSFAEFCPYAENEKRLREGEGGMGLCPKLQRMNTIRCRRCPFCKSVNSGEENGKQIYQCTIMGCTPFTFWRTRESKFERMPKHTLMGCPIKEAKEKGL